MLARLSVLLLIVLISAITISCPFVRRARKGILFIHFVLLHSAYAWDNLDDDLPIGTNVLSALSASSLLILLLEHALTLNQPEVEFYSVIDALPLLFTLVGVDISAILLHRNAFFVVNILLCLGICMVCVYLSLHPRKKTSEIPIDELDKIADGTFYYDLDNPFNCVGRQGWFYILLTISRLVVGLIPHIAAKKEVRTLFIVGECLATWLIFSLPVVIGGFVQTAKIVGRHIVEIQLNRRIAEAEKKDREQHKHRRREEILSSVEEIFGEESYFKELI